MLTREQKVGLFFLLALVLIIIAVEMTVGTGILRPRYALWAEFSDVQGLDRGAEVRVAGVKAGQVADVALAKDRVRVKLWIDRGVEVKRDAIASLDYEALSGLRLVAISLGSPEAEVVTEGETIPGETPAGIAQMVGELDKVAHSVQNLADSFNQNQEQLIANVNSLIEENRVALGQTLSNLDAITGKIDAGTGTLGRLLNDPTLYDEVAASFAEIRASFGDIGKVARQLAEGEGALGRLLHEESLYDEAREAVASLNATARNFEEISYSLRDGRGTLGRMLEDDTLYQDAQDAVRSVNRATRQVEDLTPISVLGTFVGSLF